MIRHLTAADYRVQRWANGRGETVEIARQDGPDGMLWRLSVAQVVEDGPFSRFPGIDRILTVIEGPGFAIVGDNIALQASYLSPIRFSGDLAVAAEGVAAPSRDFNVMTSRDRISATLDLKIGEFWLSGATVALFAISIGGVIVNGEAAEMQASDLILASGPCAVFATGPVLAITLDAV